MKTEKLNYHLPAELIAQQPTEVRSNSRLLVFDRSKNEILDSCFSNISEFLLPGDCLVLNDTKVLPARFFGHRSSSGKIEGLFLAEIEKGIWQVMLKGVRKLKIGERIYLDGNQKQQGSAYEAVLLEKGPQGKCLLKIETDSDTETVLGQIGFPPLPPYIKRDNDTDQAEVDKIRYQTVYAQKSGAIAAPTAGLHFTKDLIEQLKNKGVKFAHITLHVGAGTFKPVTVDNLLDHQIHQEYFSINEENAQIINKAKADGRRIVAIGTTSVRTLETVAEAGRVKAANGSTKLFISPGYEFQIIDAVVTNFHLPKSTLVALVAAFGGLENILTVYRHAVKERYRFYSYGDAMLMI